MKSKAAPAVNQLFKPQHLSLSSPMPSPLLKGSEENREDIQTLSKSRIHLNWIAAQWVKYCRPSACNSSIDTNHAERSVCTWVRAERHFSWVFYYWQEICRLLSLLKIESDPLKPERRLTDLRHCWKLSETLKRPPSGLIYVPHNSQILGLNPGSRPFCVS